MKIVDGLTNLLSGFSGEGDVDGYGDGDGDASTTDNKHQKEGEQMNEDTCNSDSD